MKRLNVSIGYLLVLFLGCACAQIGCGSASTAPVTSFSSTTGSGGSGSGGGGGSGSGGGGSTSGNCTTQTPLIDLLAGCYEISEYQGGLYAGGTNLPPAHTDQDAMTLVSQIQPLNANGNPATSGLIIFMGTGMSMALAEFGGMIAESNESGHQPANLVLANEGFSNNDADRWIVGTPLVPPPSCLTVAGISQCAENGPYDPLNSSQDGYVGNEFDYVCGPVRFQSNGYSCKQVQVGWMDISNGRGHVDSNGCGTNLLTTWTGITWNPVANYVYCIPLDSTNAANNTYAATDATNIEWEGGLFVRAAKSRMPNLKLMFFGSRIYGQYCTMGNDCADPGPYDYEKAFGIKALMTAQEIQCPTSMTCNGPVDPIAGDLNYVNGTPLILWAHAEPSQTADGKVHSAYMWANGATPRQEDGLYWCNGQAAAPCNGETDFASDGIHLTDTGQAKAGNIIFNFFSQSKYTRPWFYQ